MTAQKVTIIDTGCANLTSVLFALQRLNVNCEISADEKVICSSDKLILPGVGTAVAAMKNLNERNIPSILEKCQQPLLGICLGMQMLAQSSEENLMNANEEIKCLGIIDGSVRLMKAENLTLPHMGWNQVYHDGTNPLFKDIPSGTFFYFVHSYALDISKHTIGTCNYGQDFSAVVNKDNFYGAQFHPEKSGAMGAKLLQNFLDL